MKLVSDLSPMALKLTVQSAVRASRKEQKAITFVVKEANLQVSVNVGDHAIDMAYRRPKGEVALHELEALLTAAELELVALCQKPGSSQGQPWWIATCVVKVKPWLN
jgi:hypothetical protein